MFLRHSLPLLPLLKMYYPLPYKTGSLYVSQDNNASFTAFYAQNNGNNISLTFNQNITIQENEDYSTSVFFEQDNITKYFQTDGTVLEFRGNTLSSEKKSLIVNTSGGTINADNDTVMALADDTTINAEGDNTVILKNNISNIKINIQNGSSTIKGQSIHNSTITASKTDLTLEFLNISSSAIQSQNGDIQLTALNLNDSSLNFAKGTHKIDLNNASNNSIHFTANSIDNQSSLNIHNSGTHNSINMHGQKAWLFIRRSQDNTIQSNARWTTSRFSSSENDNINYNTYWTSISGGNISNSQITVNSSQTFSMNVNFIGGTTSVQATGKHSSLYLGEVTDDAKLDITGQHFVTAQIRTVSENASINFDSWYYSNVYIDKMLGNTLVSIASKNANVSVNSMEDNATIDLKESTVNGVFGHIGSNAQIRGGNHASNVLIAENNSNAILDQNYADFSKISIKDQNKAFSSFMAAITNSDNKGITIPTKFRLHAVL